MIKPNKIYIITTTQGIQRRAVIHNGFWSLVPSEKPLNSDYFVEVKNVVSFVVDKNQAI